MKIGIYTLHSSTNYGGALQSYALSQVLKGMGHHPEIVRVRLNQPPCTKWQRFTGILGTYRFEELLYLVVEAVKRFLVKVPEYSPRQQRELFDKFYRTYLNYTDIIDDEDYSTFIHRYDAIITGSDQVWTDLYSHRLLNFFDETEDFKGKRISYAACSAHTKAPRYNREKLQRLLNSFDAISVRDQVTAKLVEFLCSKTPELVADPTLLYNFGAFSTNTCRPYIFSYVLGGESSQGHAKALELIRAQYGDLPVVNIATPGYNSMKAFADETLEDISPLDWVKLLAESSFVYTDSFHASIFSLKYRKEFVAYYSEVIRSSRLKALQTDFMLGERIAKNVSTNSLLTPVNWDRVEEQMVKIILSSMNFLKNSLS